MGRREYLFIPQRLNFLYIMEGFWFQIASNEDVSDHNYYKKSTSSENETRSQDIRNSDIPNKNNNPKKRNKSKSSNCNLSNPPLTVFVP